VEAPDGSGARAVIQVKQLVERRDVPRLVEEARNWSTRWGATPIIAARYLAPSVRQALSAAGVSYADATGNMRIVMEKPAVFIVDRGEDRDPWRKGRPPGTLKGEPAARVVRALLDYRRHWQARDLIATAGASSGATYRVLDHLQREGLVVKSDARYSVTDWERLLRAWSAEVPLGAETRVTAFIDPRGVDHFLVTLSRGWPFRFAVTGSVAAQEFAPYAPAKAAYVYVSSIEEAADPWGLRPNEAAPNVILLEPAPSDQLPFVRTVQGKANYPVVAPSQLAADLLSGPGRAPAEGEFLIEWMTANEDRWRRD